MFFASLKTLGIQLVDFTFYGTEKYQDQFAGFQNYSSGLWDAEWQCQKVFQQKQKPDAIEWADPQEAPSVSRMLTLSLLPSNIDDLENQSFEDTLKDFSEVLGIDTRSKSKFKLLNS